MNDELDNLEECSINSLKKRWVEAFGSQASTYAYREFLINNLAYQKQAQQFGGLSTKTKKRLHKLYQSFKDNPNYRPPASRSTLKSGTRLVREWQGKVHTVTVIDKGFEYLGEEYSSLSPIARLITGARWSGPAFFGLNKKEKS